MCGIAGIINKTPRNFDYSTFCTLGISNDVRGGDSCGIFIDGKYEYGINDHKLFSYFFLDSELLNSVKQSTVALVHCRKASVGVISEETAQPVVIKNENGEVDYVLMHNGTIYNYEDLAKKYIPDMDIKGMTDSQVMAHIFYNAGYNVLDEYNGGAVFAIVDYRGISPKTLLFRGSSKKYLYSKEAEPERPLFFCIDTMRRELVFSSIWEYLIAQRRDCTVYAVRTNELLEFTGKALVSVGTYNRDKCTQSKSVAYTTKYSSYYDDYDGYGVYYDSYITINMLSNLYSYRGQLIHGKLAITDFGKVGDKYSKTTDVWFFHGVALKNESCFKFLTSLRKESRLTEEEFCLKFENVIRFLSVDGVYPKGEYWHQAISAKCSILFNGSWQPITSVTETRYVDGVRNSSVYKGTSESLKNKVGKKLEINFKEIKEECKSLMR